MSARSMRHRVMLDQCYMLAIADDARATSDPDRFPDYDTLFKQLAAQEREFYGEYAKGQAKRYPRYRDYFLRLWNNPS